MVRDLDEVFVGHRVSGVDDLAPPPRRTEDVLRPYRPISHADRLPFLEPTVQRTARDAEGLRPGRAEAPGSGLLLQDERQGRDRMDGLEPLDDVLAAIDLASGRELLGAHHEPGREVA